MTIKILMPALSPTMTEGNLAKWVKSEGDPVKAGDVIAEIETDKATMEVEAVDEGQLGKILIAEGTEGVKVNEPIALLLEEGEDASALADAGSAKGGNGAGNGAGTDAVAAGAPTAPASPEKGKQASDAPQDDARTGGAGAAAQAQAPRPTWRTRSISAR